MRPGTLSRVLVVVLLAAGAGGAGVAVVVTKAALAAPPYAAPHELVFVEERSGFTGDRRLSKEALRALVEAGDPFSSIGAYQPALATFLPQVSSPNSGETIVVARVTPGLFDVLGVGPRVGRYLEHADDIPAVPLPVVLSQRLVDQGLFQGRVGDFVHLDGVAYHVVGVMDSEFWFPDGATNAWLPLLTMPVVGSTWRATAIARPRATLPLEEVSGRAHDVVTRAGVNADLSLRSLQQSRHDAMSRVLTPMHVGASLAVVLILVNAAWLLLADARRSADAIRIRAALGATKRDLASHFVGRLVPEVLTAVPLAVVWAAWLFMIVRATLSSAAPDLVLQTLGGELTLFVLLAAVGMAVGALAPAVAYVLRLHGTLAVNASRAIAPHESRASEVLLLIQTGVALALAAQAYWVSSHVGATIEANVGLRAPDWHWAQVDLTRLAPDVEVLDPLRILVSDLADSGLRVAVATTLPLGEGWIRTSIRHIGQADRSRFLMARVTAVSPGYFSIVGLAPVKGRLLNKADRDQRVVVVNTAFATAVFPGQDPIERAFEFGDYREWRIVGVVPTVGQRTLTDGDLPEVYLLLDDLAHRSAEVRAGLLRRPYLLLDARHKPGDVSGHVGAAIAVTLPAANVQPWQPYRRLVSQAAGAAPVIASTASWLAAGAIVLLAIGTFGIWDQRALLRRREMAVRQALGASPARLLRDHIGHVSLVVGASALAGLLVFGWLQQVTQPTMALSSRVSIASPLLPFGLAAVLVWGVALAASWRPASQLRHVNVSQVLRAE